VLGPITLEVSLSLDGGLTALQGPSGAGKTSLLNIVAGLLRPNMGLVTIDEDVVVDTAEGVWMPAHRRRIGYMFQDSRLFPHLTVRQNLSFGRWFNRRASSPVTFDEVARLLDLGPLMSRHPGNLSGGERRRVALGRALLSNPRLLLLDEPLEGLAPIIVRELLGSIERVVRDEGMAAIIVEQNPRLILPITARAVVLDRGAIVHEGHSAELLADRARLDRWLAVSRA
jgi:molybdate transport system ATP-binding protein